MGWWCVKRGSACNVSGRPRCESEGRGLGRCVSYYSVCLHPSFFTSPPLPPFPHCSLLGHCSMLNTCFALLLVLVSFLLYSLFGPRGPKDMLKCAPDIFLPLPFVTLFYYFSSSVSKIILFLLFVFPVFPCRILND